MKCQSFPVANLFKVSPDFRPQRFVHNEEREMTGVLWQDIDGAFYSPLSNRTPVGLRGSLRDCFNCSALVLTMNYPQFITSQMQA